jgi:ABC-2 type transport system ATP-binding protein
MSIAIHLTGLSRTYRSYRKPEGLCGSLRGFFHRDYRTITALSPTHLEITSGSVVGLVGANGAGKTTLLKLLSGLIVPSSGSCTVLDYHPWRRDHRFLRRISILLGQKNQLWWDIAPLDSYAMLATIYDIPHHRAKDRVRALAELLHCTPQLEVQLRRLSLGERMKMEIIGALLHEPDVLFLDEPTIGLDVVAQESIREFLASYVSTHRPTIILTSHYMDDISHLADRLLLMSNGAIVYDGTVDGFTAQSLPVQKVICTLESPLANSLIIEDLPPIFAGERLLTFATSPDRVPAILQQVMKAATVQEIRTEEVDFEEVIRRFLERERGV